MSFSSCKDCEPCKRGHTAHCYYFNSINFESAPETFTFKEKSETSPSETTEPDIYGQFFGQSSFSSWSIVREDSLINVSGLVNSRDELQLYAPLGCGIQTGAGSVINAADAQPHDRVLVLGLGGVGLSAVMGAKIAGCKQIIGIDRHDNRLEIAKQLGATDVIKGDGEGGLPGLTQKVRSLTEGLGTNITVDTTGSPGLISEGIKMTAFKGKVLQVGTAPETGTLTLPIYEFMVSGKSFAGVVEGDVNPQDFIPRVIKWVQDGQLPLRKIVNFYRAEEFDKAISDMKTGVTIKPILLW